MTPEEIDSFAFGFNLTAAAYSGGAGGSFANLVSGEEDWSVVSATPSFVTQNGMEGMSFSGLAAESIIGEMRARYEATILLICRPATAGVMHAFGGTYAGGNSFGCQFASSRFQAFHSNGTSGYTATDAGMTGRANVFTASFSPSNKTSYAQQNNGAVASTNYPSSGGGLAINWPDAAIGRHRTTYFSGWIGRVLVFSRALHYRDDDTLQALITTEMASVGL